MIIKVKSGHKIENRNFISLFSYNLMVTQTLSFLYFLKTYYGELIFLPMTGIFYAYGMPIKIGEDSMGRRVHP
jgi:hypothetical protein